EVWLPLRGVRAPGQAQDEQRVEPLADVAFPSGHRRDVRPDRGVPVGLRDLRVTAREPDEGTGRLRRGAFLPSRLRWHDSGRGRWFRAPTFWTQVGVRQETLSRACGGAPLLLWGSGYSMSPSAVPLDVVNTGVQRLDEMLCGGLPRRRTYLLRGSPGVGKTTLGLQFLLEAVREDEPGLYVPLSEPREELAAVAVSHGWSIDGFHVHPLSTPEEMLEAQRQNTPFRS